MLAWSGSGSMTVMAVGRSFSEDDLFKMLPPGEASIGDGAYFCHGLVGCKAKVSLEKLSLKRAKEQMDIKFEF